MQKLYEETSDHVLKFCSRVLQLFNEANLLQVLIMNDEAAQSSKT